MFGLCQAQSEWGKNPFGSSGRVPVKKRVRGTTTAVVSFKLQATLVDNQGGAAAIIDGKIVAGADSVRGYVVKQITHGQVLLISGQKRLLLQLKT